MKKKLFILFTFILLFSAVAVMPAFASCDDCIASTENIDWSDHCEAHCTCEWDVCVHVAALVTFELYSCVLPQKTSR